MSRTGKLLAVAPLALLIASSVLFCCRGLALAEQTHDEPGPAGGPAVEQPEEFGPAGPSESLAETSPMSAGAADHPAQPAGAASEAVPGSETGAMPEAANAEASQADEGHGGETAHAEAGHGAGHGMTRKDYIYLSTSVLSLFIFLGILIRFAKKPLTQYLIERSEAVSQLIREAESAKENAEKAQAQWKARIESLDREAEEIISTASKLADAEAQRILAEAERAAVKVLEDARASIEHEASEAVDRLRMELAERAVELATRMLDERLDEGARERFVRNAIQEIEGKR